jgi:hypothetical protein
VQNGNDVNYTLFVDYPLGNGPIQHNLLAGILSIQLEYIKNETNFDIEVLSSILAPPPPPPTSSEQMSNAVTVAASGAPSQEVFLTFSTVNMVSITRHDLFHIVNNLKKKV